ncbi:helix-turn-helix domain-containing protein [Desulfoluna spongiiphila]|uniref:helix-turn-helix domain-containing protein n=1 Tax=Desulfoluna spongiiphila TaxID=419481 RepID=UPI00125A325D|nr:helix-turn-helix domain-containing protein [Desulfoluna spongiiphila]VVS91038.1 hypothetical protein DBB_6060 [Desulfoluna spongiiphila]
MTHTICHTQAAIRGPKSTLPLEEIQRLLDEGHKQTDVAQLFGTSQPTISRLCRNTHSAAVRKEPKDGPICTCCGQHTVAKGNRFLCSWCFTHADTAGPAFSEHALAF